MKRVLIVVLMIALSVACSGQIFRKVNFCTGLTLSSLAYDGQTPQLIPGFSDPAMGYSQKAGVEWLGNTNWTLESNLFARTHGGSGETIITDQTGSIIRSVRTRFEINTLSLNTLLYYRRPRVHFTPVAFIGPRLDLNFAPAGEVYHSLSYVPFNFGADLGLGLNKFITNSVELVSALSYHIVILDLIDDKLLMGGNSFTARSKFLFSFQVGLSYYLKSGLEL